MSEISAEGYAVALHPVAARFAGLVELADGLQSDLDSRIVEQAKGAISARLGLPLDIALEVLAGLARSQGREIEEYAEAVLANRGLLDA